MNDWLDAEQRIELAQQLCESSRWNEALEQIDHALHINPHNSSWWSSKAFLLDQLSRHDEAIDAYETALRLEPDNRETLTALGLDCIRTGQMTRAIDLFQQVQRIDPEYEPAYCHRVMLYTELGEHDQAETMFYLAQQLDDACPHCYWHMGCSLWLRNDIKRAIYCWQRVLAIEPRYRGARRRIADAYRRIGELGLARDYYLEEYREHPSNHSLLLEVGQMYMDNGQLEDAKAKFRQTLELDPRSVRSLELLGDAHVRCGEQTQALQAYRNAAMLTDEHPGLHYKLGANLMSLGRYREARDSLDVELAHYPTDKSALIAAGNCSLELGETHQAQGYFEQLLALDDCIPGAYHNLGVCHFLKGEYDQSIRMWQSALALQEDYALARQKLVMVYMHQRRWGEARDMLATSLSRNPQDPVLLALKRRMKYRRLAAGAGRVRVSIAQLLRRGRRRPQRSGPQGHTSEPGTANR